MGDHSDAEIIGLCPELYYAPGAAERRKAYALAEQQRLAHARPRQEDPRKYTLYITTENGRPVIWEHRDMQRMPNKRMLFPPLSKKDYYSEGDLILIGEFEKRVAERIFPELAPPEPHAPSLVGFLAMALLGLEPPKYKIGRKITAIRPSMDGTGSGEIDTVGVLFLGEYDVVELAERTEWTRMELMKNFQMLIYGPKIEVADFLEKYCEILTVVVGGLGKETVAGFTKWGVRRAVRYAVKKEAYVLLRKRLRGAVLRESIVLVRAIASFIKAFCVSMHEQKELQELKARVTRQPPGKEKLSEAIAKGCAAFSITMINESWTAIVPELKYFHLWTDIDEAVGPSLRDKAVNWLTVKLIEVMVKSCSVMLLDAYVQSVHEARNDAQFNELMNKKLTDSLKKFFLGAVEQIMENFGETMGKE